MAPHAQAIWTTVTGETAAGSFSETSAYVEAPVGRRAAIVATPWAGEDPEDPSHHWREEATLGVKASLARRRFSAMAAQAGVVWRSDPGPGCGHMGVEARWLGGTSFGRDHRSFIDLEIAAREHEGGCASGRAELTVGRHIDAHWMGMAQVFSEGRRGEETALLGQVTLVRFHREGRGVQVGLRARLDGEAREPALVIALWGGRQA